MAREYVVVDGSNIATEGRSTPSLVQLDEAVRQFMADYPGTEIVVVVDATFGHRIDPAERRAFDEAVAHGELVSPPAGAVGRGDAFVLRVAERVNARVLSNDSFQEFHAEHPWLFDEGRLIGGKPVPGIGWIFTPRSPVRGPRSRAALAARSAKASAPTVDAAPVVPTAQATDENARAGTKARTRSPKKTAAKQKAADAHTKTEARTNSDTQTKTRAKAAVVEDDLETAAASRSEKAVSKATKVAKAQKKNTSGGPTNEAQAATRKEEKTTKQPTTVKRAKAAKPAKAAKVEPAPPAKAELTKAMKAKTPGSGLKKAAVDAGDSEDLQHVPSTGRSRRRRSRRATGPAVRAAIDAATVEAIATDGEDETGTAADARRRRRGQPPPAVNDPLTFLTFVSEHPIGSLVQGVVSSFASHGAMVDVEGMQCYVPLAGLGSPPPRRAREVLERGERRGFILVALDPPRRGAQLVLPDVAATSARPA